MAPSWGWLVAARVLPGIGVGVAVSLLEVLRRAVMPHTAVLGRVAGFRREERGHGRGTGG